ncbi:MAG TPA: aminotransferase class V-fold PLP-dependent enzyme [Bacteroidia bacterium]|nr:aminotransferase class V-fold PLP-dependent enzyme [Bacteroidia bacterium]
MKNDSSGLRSLFQLDPALTYLNFGSFGACPLEIFDTYIGYERELERSPVKFITSTGPQYLEMSRKALGAYIGCNAGDVVFVANPTFAINIIARGLGLKRGDEVLSTNLEYGAMDRTWNFYGKESGFKYVQQPVDLPVTTSEKFVQDFFKGITTNTRAIFISHITSSTALILPVKEICMEAKKRGLITIVDGAHVPGHIPLDLNTLGADIYTGACHKWMMTPKGSSFLYVTKEMQEQFDPLVISWGYESDTPSSSRFLDYHQFNGTRDFSAFLTIPASIAFMQKYNWNKVSLSCRRLVKENVSRFNALLDAVSLCPVTDEWLGQMCSFQLKCKDPAELHTILFEKYNVEIPVMRHRDQIYIRYSINAFNSQDDLDILFNALSELKKKGKIS